jgi:hypothetical protein
MFNTLKVNLDTIYTITRRIINEGTEDHGYINFKSITQGVHFKFEELYIKFTKLIETVKEKINSDIVRNKSKHRVNP